MVELYADLARNDVGIEGDLGAEGLRELFIGAARIAAKIKSVSTRLRFESRHARDLQVGESWLIVMHGFHLRIPLSDDLIGGINAHRGAEFFFGLRQLAAEGELLGLVDMFAN